LTPAATAADGNTPKKMQALGWMQRKGKGLVRRVGCDLDKNQPSSKYAMDQHKLNVGGAEQKAEIKQLLGREKQVVYGFSVNGESLALETRGSSNNKGRHGRTGKRGIPQRFFQSAREGSGGENVAS